MNIKSAIAEFKKVIIERGHPSNIIWLTGDQVWLSKSHLYINIEKGFSQEQCIESAFKKYSSNKDFSASLMLITKDAKNSYCSLLIDSFGSTDDVEFESNTFYLWCDPYVSKFVSVSSKYKWFWLTKIMRNYQLSSLDYAFLP